MEKARYKFLIIISIIINYNKKINRPFRSPLHNQPILYKFEK